MKNLRFYKESDNRWYVDLPEWTGEKWELEMVLGAYTMLEYMVEGGNNISISMSDKEFENSDKLELVSIATEIGSGAFYKLEKYRGVEINLEIWLFDVTKFVFGEFPKEIYISKIN